MVATAGPGYVQHIRDRHRIALLDRFQAVGLGIGKQDATEGGGYVIVVYLDSERDRPVGPVAVEDVPLRFEVTGEIRPLPAVAE